MQEQIVMLPIDKINDSPFVQYGPRHEDIAELANSIAEQGLHTPIVVVNAEKAGEYNIVFGHRRKRAVNNLGHDRIAAVIRNYTADQIVAAQFTENEQREPDDIFAQALYLKHYLHIQQSTAQQASVVLGKPASWVSARLRVANLMSNLPDKAIERIKELPIGHVLSLIVLPNDTIIALLEQFQKQGGIKNFSSVEQFQRFVQTFTCVLSAAVFNHRDKDLLPEAGACTTCPLRTGNMPDLFDKASDKITKTDRCTNRACFAKKTALHFERTREKITSDYPDAIFAANYIEDRPAWIQNIWSFFDTKGKQQKGYTQPVYFFDGENKGEIRFAPHHEDVQKSRGKKTAATIRHEAEQGKLSPKQALKEQIKLGDARLQTRRERDAIAQIITMLETLPTPNDVAHILSLLVTFGGVQRKQYADAQNKTDWKTVGKYVSKNDDDDTEELKTVAWQAVREVLIQRLTINSAEQLPNIVIEAKGLLGALQLMKMITAQTHPKLNTFEDFFELAITNVPEPKALTKMRAELQHTK